MRRNNLKQLVFSMVLGLAACESPTGEIYKNGLVQVYYVEPITKKDAKMLGDYWIEMNLIQEKPQYLQLTKNGDEFQLKLIVNDTTLLQEIPFSIQFELAKLDSMLNRDLFKENSVALFLSDKTFTKTKKVF